MGANTWLTLSAETVRDQDNTFLMFDGWTLAVICSPVKIKTFLVLNGATCENKWHLVVKF